MEKYQSDHQKADGCRVERCAVCDEGASDDRCPGAVKDVEDTTPIYIYSTINLYCASLDIDKIVEKYREELKEEDLEAGEEDHYEDADQ